MEENEVVLSDVHISTPYNTINQYELSDSNLHPEVDYKGLDDGVPEELQKLAVTRFHLPEWILQSVTDVQIEKIEVPQKALHDHEKFDKDHDPPEIALKFSCNKTRDADEVSEEEGCGIDIVDCKRTSLLPDEDGDLIVQRSVTADTSVITIVHHLATKRDDVGHQVWLGALLLCEYILANQSVFSDHVMLDLGSGVGLTSIVAALCAKQVFSTDVHQSILKLAEYNATVNSGLLLKSSDDRTPIKVRRLDWMREFTSQPAEASQDQFSWTTEDLDDIKSLEIIIAADVVYDEDLTGGFFRTFHRFMSEPPAKELYISLEKRLVFTITDQDVVCPAYDHFRECLKDLDLCTDNGLQYHVEQLGTDFHQCFHYNRIPQLELWKISSTFTCGDK